MQIEDRQYQRDCYNLTLKAFETYNRVLGVMATGGGKTITFAQVADCFWQQKKRTLILCHRDELINQAIEKLFRVTGIFASKEKAAERGSRMASVVVGSIQTMQGQRLHGWNKDHFGLVVADECHHAISQSWTNTLNHFRSAKLLGVTATPKRGDLKNLGKLFEYEAFNVSKWSLIDKGYLSPIERRFLPIKINLGHALDSTRSGDYKVEEIGNALDPYLPRIAALLHEHAPFARRLIFCPLIATAEKMNRAMQAEGFSCEAVSGVDPDRKEKLARFESGQTDNLCNAMLLTEGYDNPSVDDILILRLTKSSALYEQMIGRGLRIHPGKTHLTIWDLLLQHNRHHRVCRSADLIAETEEEADEMMGQAEKCYGDEQMDLVALCSDTQMQREKRLAAELKKQERKQARAERLTQVYGEIAERQSDSTNGNGLSQKQIRLLLNLKINPNRVGKSLWGTFISHLRGGTVNDFRKEIETL